MTNCRPLPAELLIFARAIVSCTAGDRRMFACRLLAEVSEADRFRRSLGRSHPRFGDGTLVSRLLGMPLASVAYADDPEFLTALHIVVDVFFDHKEMCRLSLTGE